MHTFASYPYHPLPCTFANMQTFNFGNPVNNNMPTLSSKSVFAAYVCPQLHGRLWTLPFTAY